MMFKPSPLDGILRCPAPISRLKVEKIEGGLMVAGVVVANNCQIILPIFGFLFSVVGIVLTVAAYREPAEYEPPETYDERLQFTENARKLGPGCIVVGVIMLISGFTLCLLTRSARRKQHTVGFHCPLHGDFYPVSPSSLPKNYALLKKRNLCLCWPRRRGLGSNAVGPPQCPHSQIGSTRSSLASSPLSQCPTPQPFLVSSGSVRALLAPPAQLSPTPQYDNFGSLESISKGIASFPLSRTPTPPHLFGENFTASNLMQLYEEEKSNNSQFESVPVHRAEPRKSVTILMPEERS